MRHPKTLTQNPFLRAGVLSFLAFTFVLVSTSLGYASPSPVVSVGGILCSIYYNELASTTGRAIATIAVASLGVSALVGKVSWGMAIMVAVGIAVLFGASALVGSAIGISGC